MGAVDFAEWVAPDLVLPLGERTYKVSPPSVERAKKILAAAVRGEVNLGLVKGEIPDEVQKVLDTIKPDEHPALGDEYQKMVADGVDAITLNRMAYYAVFFWARGREYADDLATILWSGGDADPKARPRSPRTSGRGTALVSR